MIIILMERASGMAATERKREKMGCSYAHISGTSSFGIRVRSPITTTECGDICTNSENGIPNDHVACGDHWRERV